MVFIIIQIALAISFLDILYLDFLPNLIDYFLIFTLIVLAILFFDPDPQNTNLSVTQVNYSLIHFNMISMIWLYFKPIIGGGFTFELPYVSTIIWTVVWIFIFGKHLEFRNQLAENLHFEDQVDNLPYNTQQVFTENCTASHTQLRKQGLNQCNRCGISFT